MIPFGLKIAIIHRAFRKKLDEKAFTMGLTSVQLRVLGSISRLEAAGVTEIHQNDLERLEHITHPAMTKHIRQLERKGFVRCVPGEQDRRYKKITSTERSAGIYKTILAHDGEVFQELCRNLTQEQQNALMQFTDIILQDIDAK